MFIIITIIFWLSHNQSKSPQIVCNDVNITWETMTRFIID